MKNRGSRTSRITFHSEAAQLEQYLNLVVSRQTPRKKSRWLVATVCEAVRELGLESKAAEVWRRVLRQSAEEATDAFMALYVAVRDSKKGSPAAASLAAEAERRAALWKTRRAVG